MFCSKCGMEIKEGEKYCPNCGNPVENAGDIKGFFFNDQPFEKSTGTDNGGSYDNSGVNGNDGSYGNSGSNDNGGSYANSSAYDNGGAYTSSGTRYSQNSNGPLGRRPLRTDRGFWLFILLSFVTCGIYFYVYLYQLIDDVNIACDGDGEDTPGLLMFILLTYLTCGIYGYYWYYKLGNRLATNATRYGLVVNENGTTVLLWMILGQLLCCVGPFIAWNIIIQNTNLVCAGYNKANGYM